MKKSILIAIILLSLFELNAQINRINHYVTGTKVSIYPNQCGEDIPEAEGKLTFCRDSTLGVVDVSLGLNSQSVRKMVQNHYNNDHVFITSYGISIQKEDGTWDNVPNLALPQWSTSSSIHEIIHDAVVLPNGTIAMTGSNLGNRLVIYDMNEKTLSLVDIPDGSNSYPIAVNYDLDREVCWVLINSSNDNHLYKYENETLTFEYELDEGTAFNNISSDKWQYYNNRLFMANTNGLTVVEINDDESYSESFYDNINTGILPFDYCVDMEIDNEGFVWLAQIEGSSGGGLTKFDVETESSELYTQPLPSSPDFDIGFRAVGLDRNTGVIWVVSNNYAGFYTLEFLGETPVWNQMANEDFDALGVPYIYNVEFIHTQGEKTFFCTNSNSTSSNQEYEILVLEEGEWSGINDNEEGNISSRMMRRFYGGYADDNGGVWWLNTADEDLVYFESTENFLHFPEYNPVIVSAAVVNQNQNLVLRSQEGFGEFIPPGLVPFEETSFSGQPSNVAAWSNEIWAFSSNTSTPQHLVRYIDGGVVQEFELEEMLNFYHFTMTTDKKAIFVNYVSEALTVKIFDPETEEITDLNYPNYIGTIKEIIPAEDGKFWIIGGNALLFYNGSEFEFYDDENLDLPFVFSSNNISAAALDQNQNLHFTFLVGYGFLGSIAPPYDDLAVESVYQISGHNGLLPNNWNGTGCCGTVVLDSDGDIWLTGGHSGGLVELQRENGVPEFNVNDIVGVEELSHNNIDFEMFPNPNITGQLRIILPEGFGQSTLSILDMQGKLVGQQLIQRSNGEIDLKNITSGIYMVNISNDGYTMSKTLIVD